MSSLRKQESPAIVATPAPDDYKPQHPMHDWRPAATVEPDHLDEYTEVTPFEDTEGKKKKKKKGGLVAKAKAKLRKRKMKAAAKKVKKKIDKIEPLEKSIREIRAEQKDKKAFDAIVEKKLTEGDKEIYRESIN